MTDDDPPGNEPTLEYPDQVDTVNVLGARARRKRAKLTDTRDQTAPRSAADGGGIRIGRYKLLEMVGAGGMGMVWGAWDPELERRVAVKLVRSSSSGAQERMLREGQVLARLSHPNIVPIFDVGTVGDQVYLVMEWVKGTTLRAVTGERRTILDAYRQAGEGLAAAHDAGLVHRDFKPDNAIRGEDGRVRVLDFGIAESHTETKSRLAGTPKYMSPEQARGDKVTMASDQFAFCVSLRESLSAHGPIPASTAAVLDRGTNEDPARRFSSMHELLAALGRDPARRWRRRAIAIAVVAAAGAAFVIGRANSQSVEPCSGATAELAATWNPDIRNRIAAHLMTLGRAETAHVTTQLDDYAANWISEHRRVCLAHQRKELTVPLYEEQLGCLLRSRSQLAAVADLMSGVDREGLAPALLATRSLPDVNGCAEASGIVAPPPAINAARVKAVVPHVERVLVLAAARRGDALDDAKAATVEARATGYAPLVARALVAEGRATAINQGDARTIFEEAMNLALRASDDVVAVEAYARWIFELARNGETAIDHWTVMTQLAERTGRTGRFARALMYNNRAVAKIAADDKAGARDLLVQAQAIAGDAPELELVAIRKNLATLESDPKACADQLRAARVRLEQALGPTHPDVLLVRVPLALLDHDRRAARAELDTACRELERWHNDDAFAQCAFEAAWLADEDGDRANAVEWMKRAQHVSSDTKRRMAAAYIAVASKSADRERLLAELERDAAAPQSTWWSRLDAADALTVLATEDARAWQRVLPVIESVDHPFYARRLARARRMVAEQLAEAKPAEARRLAALALTWYREAPGEREIVARLEQLTAESR